MSKLGKRTLDIITERMSGQGQRFSSRATLDCRLLNDSNKNEEHQPRSDLSCRWACGFREARGRGLSHIMRSISIAINTFICRMFDHVHLFFRAQSNISSTIFSAPPTFVRRTLLMLPLITAKVGIDWTLNLAATSAAASTSTLARAIPC